MPDGTPRLEDVRDRILEWLRRGHFRKTACAAVRITERTLQNWRNWGEEGREPYASFLVDMDQVEAECQDRLLMELQNPKPAVPGVIGPEVWQNKAWVLERRFVKQWRGSVRLSVHEEVESLTARLKSDGELYRRVVEKLASEESPGDGAANPGTH